MQTDVEHRQAFETFINQVRKSPEYISIFLDENLKKGLKGVRIPFQDPRIARLTMTQLSTRKTSLK